MPIPLSNPRRLQRMGIANHPLHISVHTQILGTATRPLAAAVRSPAALPLVAVDTVVRRIDAGLLLLVDPPMPPLSVHLVMNRYFAHKLVRHPTLPTYLGYL